MLEGKTVAPLTLGCKVNQYETDGMVELLKDAGASVVDFHEKADIYLINTCSVTNVADKKIQTDDSQSKKTESGRSRYCRWLLCTGSKRKNCWKTDRFRLWLEITKRRR